MSGTGCPSSCCHLRRVVLQQVGLVDELHFNEVPGSDTATFATLKPTMLDLTKTTSFFITWRLNLLEN